MMVLPLILVVVLPLIYFVAISLFPVPQAPHFSAAIQALLPEKSGDYRYRQFWLDAFTTLLCPLLFLMVPIVCAVASASCAFVGEKENGTLETLFLTSVNVKSIFNAKITVCSLISVIISLVSFLAFSITASITDLLLSAPYFFNLEWLVTVLFLMPVLVLFSVTFVSLVLPRVYSVGEALQTMGYLILPFILLYLAQFTGAFQINALLLIGLAALLAVLSIILFNISARKFQADHLLTKEPEE